MIFIICDSLQEECTRKAKEKTVKSEENQGIHFLHKYKVFFKQRRYSYHETEMQKNQSFFCRTSTDLTFFFEPDAAARCGTVREEEGVYSNVVVVQYHPVIQRKGDR